MTLRSCETTMALRPYSRWMSPHEVEHARLHRDVEAGRQLVEQDQRGAVGQRLGDLDALLHAAGEVGRQVVHALDRHLGAREVVRGLLAHRRHVAPIDGQQALGDVAAGRDHEVEAVARVLVDHPRSWLRSMRRSRDVGVPDVCARRREGAEEGRAARRHHVLEEALQHRALAGAALADDAEDFALVDIEVDVTAGDDRAAGGQ